MDIENFFSQNGILSKGYSSYELREGQVALSKKLYNILSNGGIGIYEAGTGIGKSMAYLYPAYLKSKESGKPVVVSTSTNNLLSQLLYKDLPMLKKVLNEVGENFNFIGVKGKAHYACLAKMENNTDSSISEIVEDIASTSNGERSELGYDIYDQDWSKIAFDRESCAWVKCPFFKDCYLNDLKKKVQKANIIVTNHHIIFSEKLSKFEILPEYDDLIMDEGHNIENIATDYLTISMSFNVLSALAHDLYFEEKGKRSGIGAIPQFKNFIPDFIKLSRELIEYKIKIDEYIDNVFESNEGPKEVDILIHDRISIFDNLSELKNILEKIIELLTDIEVPGAKNMLLISNVLSKAIELKHFISDICNPNMIFWGKKKDNDKFLYLTPANIGDLLKKELYKNLQSVSLVSATFTVSKDFSYIKHRLGLDESVDTGIYDSPFDYKENMKVFVRKDIPLQESDLYIEKLCDAILKSTLETQGHTFVLFTSYSTMNDVADNIYKELEDNNIELLVQRGGNREEILRQFKKGSSVLFGVESFWEGIDIPGDALKQVIIVKLPFRVPSNPVEKARALIIEEEGGNSFWQLSLPQAIIKFRQGVGRLIRTKDDSGIVRILDPRAINSSYGKMFMQSLPGR